METRPNSDTLTCGSCGKDVEVSARFCGFCGQEIAAPSRATPPTSSPYSELSVPATSYLLPVQRVLLLTLVSLGLYLFYWFYLTWKQYQEHTGEEAYPVWHALCMLVPIYRLFVVHRHMRSFKKLMADAGVPSSISVSGTVLMVFAATLLNLVGPILSGAFTDGVPVAGWPPAGTLLLSLVSFLITVAIPVHVQGNLNHYWESLNGGPLPPAKMGSGEVFFAVLGALLWLLIAGMLTGIISPAPPPTIQ